MEKKTELNGIIMTDIDDEGAIRDLTPQLWKMLTNADAKIGGFKSVRNEEELAMEISLLTACHDKSGKLIACRMYKKADGEKEFGSCTDGSALGEEALQLIEIRDLIEYENFHWCEVSGAMEQYFQKFNAYPIPSKFAQRLLGKNAGKLDFHPDGLHYDRYTTSGKKIGRKAIYGFKNSSLFDEVVSDLNNKVFGSKADYNETTNLYCAAVYHAINYLDLLNEMYHEDDFKEITSEVYKKLIGAMNVLNNITDRNKTVEYNIKLGKSLMDKFTTLQLNTVIRNDKKS